ncbi:hypothetical protein [Lentzea albidocapillata]|nr:hypothetical protein [Lentzea albidocapillata]
MSKQRRFPEARVEALPDMVVAARRAGLYRCSGRPDESGPDGHPPMFRVREDELLVGVNRFLAHEVFGPYRRSLFAAGRADQEQAAEKDREDQIAVVERALRENRTRSTNLLRSLEVATEVTDEFVRDVNNRRVELQAERTRLEGQLAAFEDQVREAVNPELLDCLLITGVDLDLLPDEVSRPLFEALRLEIHYDYETRTAVCRITLTGDTVGAAERAATEAVAALPKQRSARSEQVCVVPPAGLHTDGPASDQRISSGMLVIEGSFLVDDPGGGA